MRIIILLGLIVFSKCVSNILSFGAIPNKDIVQIQFINQKAFIDTVNYANENTTDRIVVIPKQTFYMMPVRFINLKDITFFIEGKIVASKSVKEWPIDNKYSDFIRIQNSDNITIRGGGKIDGRGHHWWILELMTTLKHSRPHLIAIQKTNNILIHDLIVKNSPNFHIRFGDCRNIEIYNVNIRVNTTAQLNLIKYFTLQGAIPMFPFNTDGIDLFASEVYIHNVTCQNWDDVVVPKPLQILRGRCAQNMLVEDITVRLGVGMSIGSVPPNTDINCVKNVTFRNVYMDHPFKGIYIKSNPGDKGSGIISNIVYQNITMKSPIWWAIYIGPQQMKQPNGAGPGCMLYPFDPKGTCDTQPLVTIQNITLQNISITDSLLYPVTIRCNVSNPCRYFSFQNVTTNKWHIGQKQKGVVCQYATGIQQNSHPSIYCFDSQQKINLKRQNIQNQIQEKLTLKQIQLIWQKLYEAIEIVKYQQEDDQMTPLQQILRLYSTQYEK